MLAVWPGPTDEVLARAGNLGEARIGRHCRWMIGVAGNDLIGARLVDQDLPAGRIDLELTAVVGIDPRVDRALGHRSDEMLVVDRADVELGRAVHVDAARSDIDRGMGSGLGPERIAVGDRVVEGRGRPLVVLCRMEGHGAGDLRQAADLIGRVVLCHGGNGRAEIEAGRRQARQECPASRHDPLPPRNSAGGECRATKWQV